MNMNGSMNPLGGDARKQMCSGGAGGFCSEPTSFTSFWSAAAGGVRCTFSPSMTTSIHGTLAAATATVFSEGRASTIASNVPAIVDLLRRLAAHLGATIEIVERGELTDVVFHPRRRFRIFWNQYQRLAVHDLPHCDFGESLRVSSVQS
jgi:hypothetical protein